MNSQLKKLGTLVTIACGLMVTQADLAQAAYFNFSFGYDGGGGILRFGASPLTGVGREQISYSALENYANNNQDLDNYEYDEIYNPYSPEFSMGSYTIANPLDTMFGDDIGDYITVNPDLQGDPVFTFESGELVGINLDNAGLADIRGGDGDSDFRYISEGTMRLALEVDRYATYISYETIVYRTVYTPIYDNDGNVIDFLETEEEFIRDDTNDRLYTEDAIQFQMISPIVPVEPIPEPITLLGAGTAIGMGTIFKRKLNKKK